MPDPSGIAPPYLDPSQYPNYIDMQRKQMLAQMLMQSAQQSNQTPENWDSMRVVPKRSPLSIVGSLASALMAGKANQGALESQQRYFQGLYGGGQPSSQPSDIISAPAGGTSTVNAGPVSANVSQGAAPQGNVPGTGQTHLIPPGMDQGTAQQLISMMGPAEYIKTFVGPTMMGTPEWQTALRMNNGNAQAAAAQLRAEATAKGTLHARQGEDLLLPNGSSIRNPVLGAGQVLTRDANGNPQSVSLVPGAAGADAAVAAATEAGKTSQTPIKVGTDANGRDLYVFPTPPALAGAKGTSSAGGASGGTGLSGQTASPAVVQSQKSGAEAGQAYATELAKNAAGATEVRRSLSELKNLALQAPPSAANEAKAKIGAFMIAAGADPANVAKWTGVNIGALQAAQKQTATLAVNSIHSMTSRGTNFDLDTFMKNNPNLNMSDPSAFARVADYMNNKSAQDIAKQKDFAQWKKTSGVSPDDWETQHTAHWNELQNQAIDHGQSTSAPPVTVPTRADIEAEMRKRGMIK